MTRSVTPLASPDRISVRLSPYVSPPLGGRAARPITTSDSASAPASVSRCPESESSASERPTMPATTSASMKATSSASPSTSRRRSAVGSPWWWWHAMEASLRPGTGVPARVGEPAPELDPADPAGRVGGPAAERDALRLQPRAPAPGARLLAGDPAAAAEDPVGVGEAGVLRRQAGDEARGVPAVGGRGAELAVRRPLARVDEPAGQQDAARDRAELSRRTAGCGRSPRHGTGRPPG